MNQQKKSRQSTKRKRKTQNGLINSTNHQHTTNGKLNGFRRTQKKQKYSNNSKKKSSSSSSSSSIEPNSKIKRDWKICSVSIKYKTPPRNIQKDRVPKIIEVNFPSSVNYDDLSSTLNLLSDKLIVESSTSKSYRLEKQLNGKIIKLTIHEKLFQRLRLTGFGCYFSIIGNSSLWNRMKTVPIHPLLLRMYSTKPSNFDYSKQMKNGHFMDFEPVRLYNFVSIVASWSNHVDCFISDETFHDFILSPDEQGFYVYSYLHRVLDLFFDESERFLDTIYDKHLIPCVGKFLTLKSIKYFKKSTFLKIRSKYLSVMYRDSTYSGFVIKHKWILNHFHADLSKLTLLDNNGKEDDQYINIDQLCKLLKKTMPSSVGHTYPALFVCMCFLMCTDPNMRDPDLARETICSFETNLTLQKIRWSREALIHSKNNNNSNDEILRAEKLSPLSVVVPEHMNPLSRSDRFGGQFVFTRSVKDNNDFKKLIKKISQPPNFTNQFRLFYPGTQQRERLNPLLEFLSLLDHEVMRKQSLRSVNIRIIGDPDLIKTTTTSSSSSLNNNNNNNNNSSVVGDENNQEKLINDKDLPDLISNAIENAPPQIDCYDCIYKDNIDLPVFVSDSNNNNRKVIHYHDSFYILSRITPNSNNRKEKKSLKKKHN